MISTHGVSMTSAQYARMGEADGRQIHLAALEVLERVGVGIRQDRGCDILAAGGATVESSHP